MMSMKSGAAEREMRRPARQSGTAPARPRRSGTAPTAKPTGMSVPSLWSEEIVRRDETPRRTWFRSRRIAMSGSPLSEIRYEK